LTGRLLLAWLALQAGRKSHLAVTAGAMLLHLPSNSTLISRLYCALSRHDL